MIPVGRELPPCFQFEAEISPVVAFCIPLAIVVQGLYAPPEKMHALSLPQASLRPCCWRPRGLPRAAAAGAPRWRLRKRSLPRRGRR